MIENVIAASTGLIASSAAVPLITEPEDWAGQLRLIAKLGFRQLDLSDFWLALATLDQAALTKLSQAMADVGLTAIGASVVGAELHRSDRREESIAWVQAALANAARLGLGHVTIGLQPKPGPAAPPGSRPGWANNTGAPQFTDAQFRSVARDLHDLAAGAADLGLGLSVEMHERTMVNSASNVLRLLEMAGHPNLGVNPDLGNVIRAPWPLVETWFQTLDAVAPFVRYWHVKNVTRLDLSDGNAACVVADMDKGTIDYRAALARMRTAGYAGPLVVEHHASGDPFAVAAGAKAYLDGLQMAR